MKFEKSSSHPENIAFVKRLRDLKDKVIDNTAHLIAQEETLKIDCTTCGNCCKSLHPALSEVDIANLSIKLCLDKVTVKNKFSEYDSQKKMHYMKSSPCSFLIANKCSIYDARPLSCQDYPHLHQPHFKYRLKQIMFNYNICPIVYNTIERMKNVL